MFIKTSTVDLLILFYVSLFFVRFLCTTAPPSVPTDLSWVSKHASNSPSFVSFRDLTFLFCLSFILVVVGINPPFITFRDAGFCINTFPVTVLDCARSMRRACNLGHFNYKTFNVNGFHALAKLQNGDFSWIVPGKFLAFSGPLTK